MPDEPTTVDAPQQDATQAAPEAAPQQDGQALDRILSRVNEIGDQVAQWQQTQPEPTAEPEVDDVTAILQQLGYEPDAEPDYTEQQIEDQNLTPQQLVELVVNASQQATQAELQRSVNPVLAQQQEQALDAAFVDLEGKYPKLLDEEWQGKVLDSAETLAQATGNADWLENPQLIELVHKSLLADELAAQETPVEPTDPGLENPRGANPSPGEDSQTERADRIVAAGPNKALKDAGFFG